jgi:hypothetical protein
MFMLEIAGGIILAILLLPIAATAVYVVGFAAYMIVAAPVYFAYWLTIKWWLDWLVARTPKQ